MILERMRSDRTRIALYIAFRRVESEYNALRSIHTYGSNY